MNESEDLPTNHQRDLRVGSLPVQRVAQKDPLAFELSMSPGSAIGEATLWDEHAGFTPAKLRSISRLIERGLRAGLVGPGTLIWTVGDDGWIFEGKPTNVETPTPDVGLRHRYLAGSNSPLGGFRACS